MSSKIKKNTQQNLKPCVPIVIPVSSSAEEMEATAKK